MHPESIMQLGVGKPTVLIARAMGLSGRTRGRTCLLKRLACFSRHQRCSWSATVGMEWGMGFSSAISAISFSFCTVTSALPKRRICAAPSMCAWLRE